MGVLLFRIALPMRIQICMIVALVFVGTLVFSSDLVFAADPITEVSNPLSFGTVDGLLERVLGYLQTVIVTIALIFLLVGGFLYITSSGDSGRIDTAKNCIFYALFGLAIGIAAPAFIKQIYDILGVGAPVLPAGSTSLTVLEIAKKVLDFLLSVVGVVAIIMLVVGAIMYLTAAGDEDRIDTGKKIAKYSIIGIMIALASIVLVRQLANFL